MAFVEYILLALLGSTAAAPGATPGNAGLRTFAAESVAQPAGGEMGDGTLNARTSPGSVANSNSKGKATKAHKGGKKGHKGGKKGKKGSGTTTTPPPK